MLDQIMIGIALFGVPILVAVVVFQWWSRSDRLRVRHTAICAGLAFLLGLVLNQGILLFIHRIRPYDVGVTHLLIARSADWSFPSDHATTSMAVAMAFVLQKLPRRALIFVAMALLVSLSRIYVGTHYVGDVFGGAMTGAVAAIAVRYLYPERGKIDRIATSIF